MSPESVTPRRGEAGDVDAIVDLLVHYDPRRSHLEALYHGDPCYEPSQSWVMKVDHRLVAHVRVFPRTLRLGPADLPVAALGDAITSAPWRGHGHMEHLLETVLSSLETEQYAFAMAWPPTVGAGGGHGFDPLMLETTSATVPAEPASGIACFRDDDLPELEAFACRGDVALPGTTVRSLGYWRCQLNWLEEDRRGFLVARTGDGEIGGYVRSRRRPDHVEILELTVPHGDRGTARALLGEVARPYDGALTGHLPHSYRVLLEPDCRPRVETGPGPVLRVLNPAALRDVLARLAAARPPARDFDIAVDAPRGPAFNIGPDGVRPAPSGAAREEFRHSPAELVRLLLGGAAPQAPEELRLLFPAQDWVLWEADRT
ncbi:GNAT family N-acetyltransferase [Microbispora sp. NPDC049125]|uniref:GNAT family N-acetyltransferase n=1 Tax=Microbispora sp. NPDC049125 TaxID=3154929 RepID=UPI0034655BFC